MRNDVSPPWDDLRVLLALHRHRSFLAAGRALGVSTSTAARRIDALEAALARPLVHRTNAGTIVDRDALDLVALAEQMELGLQAIRRDAATEQVAGTVRVSLAEAIARPITKLLCDLRRLHRKLELEIISETRLVDIGRREADIAVRSSRVGSSAVIHRAVGRGHFGLFASISYVDRHLRAPRLSVADFPRHDFVAFDLAARTPKTSWLIAHGASRFVVRSNSELALLEAALDGQGIALLPESMARDEPRLLRLDVDAELPSVPVYLAYHRELRSVPRVRLTLNAIDVAMRALLR